MRRLRAIIVASLTLALAALPVAGGSASVAAEGPAVAAQMDCAKHVLSSDAGYQPAKGEHATADQAQSKPAKGNCNDHPDCAGNCLCLGLCMTAVLPLGSHALTGPRLGQKTAALIPAARSQSYIPQPPPPRV